MAEFLDRHRIAFAVIGGIAVAVRGETRTTVDVDLLVQISVERGHELLAQLDSSPFLPLFPDVAEVMETAFLLPLQHRDTGIRLDLALALSGFEQQAVRRASSEAIAGGCVPVITAEDLIIMKTLAGRSRDTDDVERLVSLRRDEIDWEYVFTTAEQLQKAVDQDLLGPLRKLRE
ncbi:MAG: hypothetical protein K8T25_13765 [Planctomycetia bacterium]|nr:hypothetical protein [Planctomycetia bacterium]